MATAQYNQVADRLRRKILAGKPAPGARLPTERAMCVQYAVSRITIRQALTVLQDEKLIVRRQGSGTYVRQNPTRRIPLRIDYTGSMLEHAPTLVRELLVSRAQPAPEWVADELRLPLATEVLYAERLDRIGQTAVAWDEVYIPLAFAGTLTEQLLARVDFVEAWRDAQGLAPTVCRQQIEAVAATAIDRNRLRVAVKAPLLKTTEIYYGPNARPIGLFVSHYHPAHITVTSRHRLARNLSGSVKNP
jgi:DNA-binding GntR family transcriptional regulator